MTQTRVFIVDDDVDFAESLAEVIEARDCHVELAYSGEEAIARFREEDFDIAFMDVKLPGKNGVESFLEIKRLKPDAKVMMMTGYSVEQLLEQAVEGGVLGVLSKPLDFDQIFHALEKVKENGGLVLIADDDLDFCDSLSRVIESKGYSVLVAHTGQEAVDTVLNNAVDFLVLDLKMPIMGGLETYMEIRKRGHSIPTVIVTGYASEEADVLSTLQTTKVSGCFVKPFDPMVLLDFIKKAKSLEG